MVYVSKGTTKSERLARERLYKNLKELQHDDALTFIVKEDVPEAWHTLSLDLDVTEKKIKITLLLDESVAKFYRCEGRGYQARINRILGTYAQMKMANLEKLFVKMREDYGPDFAGIPDSFR